MTKQLRISIRVHIDLKLQLAFMIDELIVLNILRIPLSIVDHILTRI